MLPELGHLALILAGLLALLLAVLALRGAQRNDAAAMALAPRLAAGVALFAALAFAALAASFVADDFSVRNVAENSNTRLPAAYRFTAAWGSHEGSMLLWVLLQSLWMLAVALGGRSLPAALHARALGVLALVAAGFVAFVLFASNPFVRVFPIPAQGRDLNPLLQDPGMVAHPPLLYMGYVGLSVSFAFALAALLGGDRGWARHARPWAAAAWGFLTLGVAVGSGWAYYELGWGGWWFWDPVENAALMPWLAATALLHALAVADRRGALQAWAVLLAIGSFALALLGTFVVRSGVLASVHAFALDPRRGLFVLALLLAVAGGSLALFARHAARLGRSAPFAALSRETLLLAGTLLLAVVAGTVLLGTFYPLVHDALGLGRLSVGPPYFEAVFVPLFVPVLCLLGIAPLVHWGRDAWPGLLGRARAALAGALLAGIGAAWWADGRGGLTLGITLAAWVALATLQGVAARRHALARQPRAWWGMVLAHLGMALCVTGMSVVRSLQTETELRMAPGDSVAVGAQVLRFEGVTATSGPNYEADRGGFVLLRDGVEVGRLHPEKRRYASLPSTPMTEAAIAGSWRGDVYVSLGEDLGGGAWSVRAQHKPLVTWIWAGAALMALGAALAAADRRRGAPATPTPAAAA